jgi:GT2 family glycosyltransferase
MPAEPSISVVIPTHKTRERTLRCLAALWLCNPQPDEVIVVDDGSEDNTAHSVLRKYPRHIVVRLPKPQGFAAAVNHGVARASGDLLLLLDNRTEVDPPAVGAIRQVFDAREDLGVAGAALRGSNAEPQWSGGRIPGTLWCFALASGLPALLKRFKAWRRLRSITRPRRGQVDWVSGAAMVVRRSLWAAIGPFDPGYRYHGHYLDLCVKASEAGWRVEIVPEFTAVHPANGPAPSEHSGADVSNDELMWSDLLRFAGKRNGNTGARQSGRALRMGGRLRVIGRQMAAPLVAKDHQQEWRAETNAYAETLRMLTEATREGRQRSHRAAR